jgi:hypothetical protein
MKLVLQTIALAALFAWLPHATPTQAQDRSADTQAFEKKQRRLNIAGWTLVGAGAAFPVIAVPISAARGNWGGEDCDRLVCPDVAVALTSLVLGPVMIVTGGALLLKRRGLRKEHERQPEVAITPGVTGLMISGRF